MYLIPAATYLSLLAAPTFPGEQSTTTSAIARRVTQTTMAFVACLSKCLNFCWIVVGAVKRKALPNGKVATKGRSRLGHTDDFHVVLRIYSICDALSNGTVSVDGDFDGHALLHAFVTKAVNKTSQSGTVQSGPEFLSKRSERTAVYLCRGHNHRSWRMFLRSSLAQ